MMQNANVSQGKIMMNKILTREDLPCIRCNRSSDEDAVVGGAMQRSMERQN
jgi:hypothetical protein